MAGWLGRQLEPAKIGDALCEELTGRLPLAHAGPARVRAALTPGSYAA